MRGSNADLNKVIDAQKASITQQKAKIDNLMKTKKDFAAAQIELDNMRGLVAGYKNEIEALSKDKAALTVRVAEVTKEKEQVAAELGTVSAEKAVLTTEKTELTTAKQNLEAQNDTYLTELKRVPVKVLSAEPKYRDKSGKLKSNTAMRSANVVEVVLELGDNERAEPGNEQFFIQIMNPVGEPVNVAGKFQNAKDKTEIRYTKAFTYDYSKKKKQVTALVDMEGMSNKNNGTYDFKVFNKGYYAGEGSFKLDF
jgi:seryl-tRNA synthetase